MLGGLSFALQRKGGNRFANHMQIESAAAPIFQQLAKENYLAGLRVEVFSHRAAYYLGELNALHPFREGNGRAQREFISHLAQANDYYVAWENMPPPPICWPLRLRLFTATSQDWPRSFVGTLACSRAVIF